MNKPFSQACENNKQPILAVLQRVFADARSILEVGAGTGQHCVFFAPRFPKATWWPTDLSVNLPGIRAWQAEYPYDHLMPVDYLDVGEPQWLNRRHDAIFSANTVHIMSWPMVMSFFDGVGQVLESEGVFAVYGPFNYGGAYTSQSNAQFDLWLKQQNPLSGIRDVERVNALAEQAGMCLLEDNAMPANNRLLVWRKQSPAEGNVC